MGSAKQRNCSVLVALFLVCSGLCVAKTEQSQVHHSNPNTAKCRRSRENSCNMYVGTWVWDDSFPLYNSSECPSIRKEFDCLKYGRPDHSYLKYRWQPENCDLPRFNGEDFLQRMEGKKIMFIGDSISLNQWQSLICLLHAAMPSSNVITRDTSNSITTVTFQDYKASVLLFRSPYLVDIETNEVGRVLKLDSLKNGAIWKEIDILVFNTWLWWYRRGVGQPWDYIQDGDTILKDMDRMVAFRKGLTTWAKWVDSDIDINKTKVYFQGVNPSHYKGVDWNEPGVNNCAKETIPLNGSTYPAGLPLAQKVIEEVLSGITKPVHLLNITTLSQLRKDAHPASYNGMRGMDCTHWCVGGLPDTWNQLLYASLL
ncbi:Trichome birefringence-like, N-terminal domain [Dillenia turbinata]|uniref:Trichome birefringence-like, N-terminal domain n=1 Tax=Dillenia turbinata TaxID=194707 RepID=A0AAN8VHW3_9MAGN